MWIYTHIYSRVEQLRILHTCTEIGRTSVSNRAGDTCMYRDVAHSIPDRSYMLYSPTPGSPDTNNPPDLRTSRCVYVSATSRMVRVEHWATCDSGTFQIRSSKHHYLKLEECGCELYSYIPYCRDGEKCHSLHFWTYSQWRWAKGLHTM